MILSVFAFTCVLVLLLARLSLKTRVLLRNGVPAIGGIALGLSVCAAVGGAALSFPSLAERCAGVMFPALVMLAFGILDDFRELSIANKFVTHFAAASALVLMGVKVQIAAFGPYVDLALTFLWVVGITNAFNHLDVMDGVCGGCAFFTLCSLAVISLFGGDFVSLTMAVAALAGVAAFLLFNLPPARVYLGNAGSHFIGFFIAALALQVRYAPSHFSLALAAPVLILLFPISDTLFLMAVRHANGRSVFRKSNDHIVLRLALLGMPKTRVVYLSLAAGAVFALTGLAVICLPARFSVPVLAAVLVPYTAFLVWLGRIPVPHE